MYYQKHVNNKRSVAILFDYLIPQIPNLLSFSDSLSFALTAPLDEIIKPEKYEEWVNVIQPQWFVQNPDDPDQAREPGLLKIEQHITKGSIVALRNALKLILNSNHKSYYNLK